MNAHKAFSFADYDVYGFDLDGCLAKYHWEKVFQVSGR